MNAKPFLRGETVASCNLCVEVTGKDGSGLQASKKQAWNAPGKNRGDKLTSNGQSRSCRAFFASVLPVKAVEWIVGPVDCEERFFFNMAIIKQTEQSSNGKLRSMLE